MSPDNGELEFIAPPEAPVFEPTEEEFKDPLAYIAKIRPFAVKTGICKIRPPPDWQPSFSVDVEKFHFTPRIQRLNELEAKSRVKLNFLDAIAKFWELQGSTLKLPTVEKKPLDLYSLHKSVQEEGGYEDVVIKRKWARVAQRMGFPSGKSIPSLRTHYEKILFPYDVFLSGAMTGDDVSTPPVVVPKTKQEQLDEDYQPPLNSDSDPDGEASNETKQRRNSSRKRDGIPEEEVIDYVKNPQLKKLRFVAPGPKMITPPTIKQEPEGILNVDDVISAGVLPSLNAKVENKETQELTRRRTSRLTTEKKLHYTVAFVDDYRCQVCDRGDAEECMLLCDNCDSSYHTFCLIPPLNSVPPGDWRCPKCVAHECNKPQEAYGFEQAKKRYNLREFGVMADRFKEDYFAMPPHEVPSSVVEKEFWRLVNSLDDEVVVEYGADLHTAEHGSGFPMENNTSDPDDEEYINSWWNLNNLPVHDKSVLRFISANISGMKVPWLYVGMCFSSFCWHNEDHWSYSINYLHWGEPKTWYGVPGDGAEKLEACMKETAPELFEAQPDLLHHLVTILSPITLIKYGVPIVRTNQYAGEFVVTFPRAYHAGFNQGYNCAEAVNFCPADWLPSGRHCIDHYRSMNRCPVFSHDELVCKMALEADTLDLEMAKSVYVEMDTICKNEVAMRLDLIKLGMVETLRVEFELLPDDEKQCKICRTTCFLSAVVCHCNKERLCCLLHAKEMCQCQASGKSIRYRYKMPEMEGMVARLKRRADVFDNWKIDVKAILDTSSLQKQDLSHLKELVVVAVANRFPPCDSLDGLKTAIADAEQCSQVATQLFIKKHKTRNSQTHTTTQMPRVTLQELQDFVQQMESLRCIIKESRLVQGLLNKVKNFQYEAQCVLAEPGYDIDRVTDLLGHGATLEVELPEIEQLEQCLATAKWLKQVEECLKTKELVLLDLVRTLVNQGTTCTIKPGLAKLFSSLKELLFVSDRWEEKAKLCLQAKPRHMASTLEAIVQEASKVNVLLPHVNQLKDALQTTKEWTEKVEKIQNLKPYADFDLLEALVLKGRPVPVRLDYLPQMESQVAAAKAWKDRTSRTFVKKGSTKTLLEVLLPRRDVGRRFKDCLKAKKKKDKDERERDKKESDKERETTLEHMDFDQLLATAASPDRATQLAQRKDMETTEIQGMKKLRAECRTTLKSENVEGPYCVCRKGVDGLMLRCQLCLEWFHNSCVPFPKSIQGKSISKSVSPVVVAKEVKYLCPFCCRSRRPRLETILSLLMSLQKLPVRIPEGEALQYLTERAMNWQERAKLILGSNKIAALLSNIKSDGRVGDGVRPTASSSSSAATYSAYIQKSFGINQPSDVPDGVGASVTVDTSSEMTEASVVGHGDAEKTAENLLTLECTESMGGSPGATGGCGERGKVATPEKLTSRGTSCSSEAEMSSRSVSPIDVVAPGHEPSTVVGSSSAQCCLTDYLLDQLGELAMEGELLEVTLDETHQLWLILQDQRPLTRDECRIMDPDYRKRLLKERKKKKRRLENTTVPPTVDESKPPLTIVLPRPRGSKPEATHHTETSTSPTKKKRKREKGTAKGSGSGVKKEHTVVVDDVVAGKDAADGDEEEDTCAARTCDHPIGDEVGWVQCDTCSGWFHVVCVGLTATVADALETYACPACHSPATTTDTIASTVSDRDSAAAAPPETEATADGVMHVDELPTTPSMQYRDAVAASLSEAIAPATSPHVDGRPDEIEEQVTPEQPTTPVLCTSAETTADDSATHVCPSSHHTPRATAVMPVTSSRPNTVTPDTVTPITVTPDTVTSITVTPDTVTAITVTPDTVTASDSSDAMMACPTSSMVVEHLPPICRVDDHSVIMAESNDVIVTTMSRDDRPVDTTARVSPTVAARPMSIFAKLGLDDANALSPSDTISTTTALTPVADVSVAAMNDDE